MNQLTKSWHKISKFFILHENWSAFLFFLVLLAIFFFPIVFQGKAFSNAIFNGGVTQAGPYGYAGDTPPFLNNRDSGASSWQEEPLSEYIGKIVKEDKKIPLWNPNMGFGYPLFSGIQMGILSPLNYIVFFFSSALAWDVLILFRILLAGFFTYLFARKIKLAKAPSLLAGVVFMFCGYILNYLNMAHMSTEALVPLILYAYELFLDKPNLKIFLFCIAANALMILPGMPEASFLALMLGGLWFSFSLFFLHAKEPKERKIILLGGIIVAGILALMLTAIQLLPFAELLNISFNTHSSSNAGLSYIHFSSILSLIFPYLFYPVNGFVNSVSYVGVAPIVLAFLSVLGIKYFNSRNRKIVIFFGLFVIISLAKIYGLFLINWIGGLPILKTIIFPKYLVPEISFGVAILAALGFSLLLKKNIRYLNLQLSLLLLVILGLIGYTFRQLNPSFAERLAENDFIAKRVFSYFWPLLHLKVPPQLLNEINASPTILYWLVVLASGIVIYLLFWVILANANNLKKSAGWLILVFVTSELFVYTLPLIRMSRYDTFKKPPFVDKLQQDKSEIYRTYGQAYLNAWSSLHPNTSSVYDVQDVRFLLALGVERYFKFMENVLGVPHSEIMEIRITGNSILPIENRAFGLMNVKYFLLPKGSSSHLPQAIMEKGVIVSANGQFIGLANTVLNNKFLSGLMLHAPSAIKFPFPLDEKTNTLSFDYGIAGPAIDCTDGVRFMVKYQCNGVEKEIFNDLVDPANNPKYRNWQTVNLNIPNCVGQPAQVTFISDSYQNGDCDQFFVGNFSDNRDDLYYNGELEILKNKNYLPRTFIVHRAEYLKEEARIFSKLKDPNFDLRNTIVVEKELSADKLSGYNSPQIDNSEAKIINYQDDKVNIMAKMENPGFLVLLDQYYPGWKAYVDGKETEIYPTDYTFRSVYLDKGNHKVEFIYDPLSYKVGKYISLAAIILFIGLYLFRKKIENKLLKKDEK
jgi:hypothetical protein